jgi:uroporphyrin-III C-methyltransferase
MKKGCVYLVGAGPGDPGLLTIKALDLIRKADVIIYDHLVNPELLCHAPGKAELIFGGKYPRNHLLFQDEINKLLVSKARQGEMVVRLKGGDPLLFGRGAEEALALVKAGIPFEIVPGVSSSYAVPAYAGIPLTLRNVSSRLNIVTGHEASGKNKNPVDWGKLIDNNSTLVILMGLANLEKIIKAFGQRPAILAMPAAVISNGTKNDQKVIVGRVSTIVKKVRQQGIKAPTIIVVGKVAALHRKLDWFTPAARRAQKI